MRGGSDKLSPTLSYCYCCLTSPFFTRKSMVKIFVFVSFRGFDRTIRTIPGSAPDMACVSQSNTITRAFRETQNYSSYREFRFTLVVFSQKTPLRCLASFCVQMDPGQGTLESRTHAVLSLIRTQSTLFHSLSRSCNWPAEMSHPILVSTSPP